MNTQNTGPDLVMVPVPSGALPLIHETLNSYYQSLAAGPSDATVAVPKNGEWSYAEVKGLFDVFRNPKGRAVILKIASAHGAQVTYGELAEAGDLSFDQLRAQLAWFAKYAKKIKNGEHVWPMYVTENSTNPKAERYLYAMPEGIADWWLKIAGEAA